MAMRKALFVNIAILLVAWRIWQKTWRCSEVGVKGRGSSTVGKRSAGGERECGVIGLSSLELCVNFILFFGGGGGAGYRGSCIESMEGLFALVMKNEKREETIEYARGRRR